MFNKYKKYKSAPIAIGANEDDYITLSLQKKIFHNLQNDLLLVFLRPGEEIKGAYYACYFTS
jgi:hypothetical protein